MVKVSEKIKIFLINIFLIFLIFLVFEIFSGDLIFKNKFKCSYILCNANYTYKTDLYTKSKITINYKKDEFGLRGRKNKIDDIQILTMGGSTTDERYMNLENTWSERLEKLFNNKNFDVVNAGIDGQSSFGHIWNFTDWLNKIDNLKVSYVIFYIGINEKENSGRHDLSLENVKYPKKILYMLKYNNGIISKIYELFFHRFNPIDELNVAHSKSRDPVFYKVKNSQEFNTSKLNKNIKTLIMLANSLNMKPIFITQRTLRWKKNEREIFSVNKNYNFYMREKVISESILNICEQFKLICLDGFTELPLEINDTYDLVHTNPQGSKKIANYIYKKLNKEIF